MSIFGDNPLAGLELPVSDPAPAPTDTPSAPVDSGQAPAPVDPGPLTPPPAAPSGELPVDAGAELPPPAYFDPEGYKDQLVKLKVGGQDVEMSLHEALQGAMRGADYTRKTQELADDRRKLHQANALTAALESDPEDTIRRLATAYDLDVSELRPIQRDPAEQQLVDHQRTLRAQQAQLHQQQVRFEINRLMNDFGVAENDLPTIAAAADRAGTDLETAYKAMQFDTLRAQQAEASRTEAARAAARNAQLVHSGSSTQRGAATPAPEKIDSIRDAWRVAEKQLNLPS